MAAAQAGIAIHPQPRRRPARKRCGGASTAARGTGDSISPSASLALRFSQRGRILNPRDDFQPTLKSSDAPKNRTSGLLTTPASFIAWRKSVDLMNFFILAGVDQRQRTVRSFGELLARK